MISGLVLTTLRLYLAQIVVTAALLAVLVVAAVADGLTVASFISEYGDSSCPPPAGCGDLAMQVSHRYRMFGQLLPFLALLPAAIGAFWGAPLLGREYENGTTKFAWTQSVSRRSWILTRMIVLGSLIALGGIAVGVAVDYWLARFAGFDLPGVEADFGFSQIRGVAPVGWWLFGFTFGALSGALLRRTIPAMALTVAAVVSTVIARNLWFGLTTEGQPLAMAAQRLQHIETATLITTAVLLAAATCFSVEHARA